MHYQPLEPVLDSEPFAYAMHPQAEVINDPLDDVFGSETDLPPPGNGTNSADAYNAAGHPSDIRRLQADHTTAGYREGLSSAKDKSVQAGFDEGFSLGATIGLESGKLLGLLEGIVDALRPQSHSTGDSGHDLENTERLYKDAVDDLSTEKLFSAEYWEGDGNWKFEVKPKAGNEDILFQDVAHKHPLIRKWTVIVDELLERWGIDRTLLDQEKEEKEEGNGTSGGLPGKAKPLDW